jgi:NAD(P)-dependent dehydrogenase (short-subunit alcohol dehydrogenase family)
MQDNHQNLRQSAVLITGATGGISQQFLKRALKQHNWHFILVSRDLDRLQNIIAALLHSLNDEIGQNIDFTPRIHMLQGDVSQDDQAQNILQQAKSQFPQLSIEHLVHGVGSTLIAPLHKTSIEQYHEVLKTNLHSSFFILKAFIDHILQAKQQSIIPQDTNTSAVLFSSVVSQIAVSNHEAIAVAKAGVEALIKSAAATYAPQKIRVNGVAPGLTETPLVEKMLKNDIMRQAIAKQYPLEGIQSADDIAQGVLYLLDQQRSTGQILVIDGGFSAIRPLVR